MKWKLLDVEAMKSGKFKFVAHFESSDGRHRATKFGARGYEDYTIHKDKKRRERYRIRHQKDLLTKDPTRAGFLSYYILWGRYTDLNKCIEWYRKKLNSNDW